MPARYRHVAHGGRGDVDGISVDHERIRLLELVQRVRRILGQIQTVLRRRIRYHHGTAAGHRNRSNLAGRGNHADIAGRDKIDQFRNAVRPYRPELREDVADKPVFCIHRCSMPASRQSAERRCSDLERNDRLSGLPSDFERLRQLKPSSGVLEINRDRPRGRIACEIRDRIRHIDVGLIAG